MKLNKINKFTERYQSLIQAIGILSAVIILGLTTYTTWLSHDSLELARQQEFNKQLPIWDWVINDSTSVVKLKPFNSDIKVQYADAYFSKIIYGDTPRWPLNQPDFQLHLTMFKYYMAEEFKKIHSYNPDFSSFSERNTFPFGLQVNYIQYGIAKTVKGIFVIQYTVVRTGEQPTIIIDGVLFDKYLSENENFENTIESLTKQLKDGASKI